MAMVMALPLPLVLAAKGGNPLESMGDDDKVEGCWCGATTFTNPRFCVNGNVEFKEETEIGTGGGENKTGWLVSIG